MPTGFLVVSARGVRRSVLAVRELSSVSIGASPRCRSRVIGPEGDPLGINAAERLRSGQV